MMIDKELETMRSWDGVDRRVSPRPLYVKARLLSYFTMLILSSAMLSGLYITAKFIWEQWL